jgi:hypothetical protein
VECWARSDTPTRFARAQHIGKSVVSMPEDDAVSFWQACFRWRVLGPSRSHRAAGSDMLERLRDRGMGMQSKALGGVLREVLSSLDPAANADGATPFAEGAGCSDHAGGGVGAGGEEEHSLLGHLVETLHSVAYGSHAPEGSAARHKAPSSASKASQSPSGIQWDMAHVTHILALAARCTPPASACKGLARAQQAMLARLLVRDGLWAALLRQCAQSADARDASSTFRVAVLAWLAHMHPPAPGPQSEARVTCHVTLGASEAEEVAPNVWEEGQALVKCVKTGWKMAGIGAQEAQQTLAATFHIYLTMPARPAPALALVSTF